MYFLLLRDCAPNHQLSLPLRQLWSLLKILTSYQKDISSSLPQKSVSYSLSCLGCPRGSCLPLIRLINCSLQRYSAFQGAVVSLGHLYASCSAMEPVGAIHKTGLPIWYQSLHWQGLQLPLIKVCVTWETTAESARFPIPRGIILRTVNLCLIVSMHALVGFPADVAALAKDPCLLLNS